MNHNHPQFNLSMGQAYVQQWTSCRWYDGDDKPQFFHNSVNNVELTVEMMFIASQFA